MRSPDDDRRPLTDEEWAYRATKRTEMLKVHKAAVSCELPVLSTEPSALKRLSKKVWDRQFAEWKKDAILYSVLMDLRMRQRDSVARPTSEQGGLGVFAPG